jgi:hypothetical protein
MSWVRTESAYDVLQVSVPAPVVTGRVPPPLAHRKPVSLRSCVIEAFSSDVAMVDPPTWAALAVVDSELQPVDARTTARRAAHIATKRFTMG